MASVIRKMGEQHAFARAVGWDVDQADFQTRPVCELDHPFEKLIHCLAAETSGSSAIPSMASDSCEKRINPQQIVARRDSFAKTNSSVYS